VRIPVVKKSHQLLTIVAVGAISLGACSSGSSNTGGTTTTQPVKVKTTRAPVISQKTITINGKVVVVPREEYSLNRPIASFQDNGTYVIISNKGVLPQVLNAPAFPVRLSWVNLTAKPITVNFSFFGTPGSEVIAPGTTYSFIARSDGNVSYVTSTGYNGTVGVGELPLPAISPN
jgi:hypothetical protein